MKGFISKIVFSVLMAFAFLIPTTQVNAIEYTLESYDWESYYDDWSDLYNDYSTYDLSTEDAAIASILTAVTLGTLLLIGGCLTFALYIYNSLAMMKIAKDLDHDNPWFAWIPILNTIQLFQLGGQNPWLILLVLIPGIGALVVGIISIIAIMNICEKKGYDKLFGLLILVPIAQLVLIGVLAWGKGKKAEK